MTEPRILPFEVIFCPQCGQETPKVGNKCMMCGAGLVKFKSTPPTPELEWLTVAPDADTTLISLELSKKISLTTPPIPIELIIQALDQLAKINPQHVQVLIRWYGLDGKPPRTLTEIAASVGKKIGYASRLRTQGTRKIRHPEYGLQQAINELEGEKE
ncbi:hypothetical protein HGA91_01495 [candidate division WWE3 bacterium]|nr:hypothetical protein [candidate division WWE3 bacterium]